MAKDVSPVDVLKEIRAQAADLSNRLVKEFSRTQMVSLATANLQNALGFLDREIVSLTDEAKAVAEKERTTPPNLGPTVQGEATGGLNADGVAGDAARVDNPVTTGNAAVDATAAPATGEAVQAEAESTGEDQGEAQEEASTETESTTEDQAEQGEEAQTEATPAADSAASTGDSQPAAQSGSESAQTSAPADSEEAAAGDATDQASESTESSSTGESAGAQTTGA